MLNKKQIRAAFRNAVFKRDGYKCMKCGREADSENPEDVLDAHHIQDRSIMPYQGTCLKTARGFLLTMRHLSKYSY